MSPLLFWLFAIMTLVFGVAVVANRNPVASALSLVVSFLGLAALFVGLDAYFIAVIQVLVYAGAVMVLFLFVIMLLDLKEEQRRRANKFGWATGIISVGAILTIFLQAIFENPAPGGVTPPALEGATHPLGKMLFNDYLLPFEILSVLLLVAMVGVILLSKKDLK